MTAQMHMCMQGTFDFAKRNYDSSKLSRSFLMWLIKASEDGLSLMTIIPEDVCY